MINYTNLVNKNKPVIVQIGAHDGVLGEEYGLQELLDSLDDFKLILVEPVDKFFNNLHSVYGKYGDREVEPTKKELSEHLRVNVKPELHSIVYSMWDGKPYDHIIWRLIKPEFRKL